MWPSFVSCNYFSLVHFRESKFKLFAQVKFLPANLQMLGLFAEKHCLSLKLDCDSCKDYSYNVLVTVYRWLIPAQNITFMARTNCLLQS